MSKTESAGASSGDKMNRQDAKNAKKPEPNTAQRHEAESGQLCANCRQRPAELSITEVNKEGKASEIRLCAECAQARGVVSPGALKQTVAEILVELKNRIQDTDQRLLCANCGLSYAEFKASGRLGCEHCYIAFAERLNPVIKRIHGALRHTGRVPQRDGKAAARNFEVQRLRRELKRAINAENYERAAAVRDRIKQFGAEDQ